MGSARKALGEMKRLVADTGPILHLHQAGALHLLPLIGEILLTQIVLAELRAHAPDFFTEVRPRLLLWHGRLSPTGF